VWGGRARACASACVCRSASARHSRAPRRSRGLLGVSAAALLIWRARGAVRAGTPAAAAALAAETQQVPGARRGFDGQLRAGQPPRRSRAALGRRPFSISLGAGARAAARASGRRAAAPAAAPLRRPEHRRRRRPLALRAGRPAIRFSCQPAAPCQAALRPPGGPLGGGSGRVEGGACPHIIAPVLCSAARCFQALLAPALLCVMGGVPEPATGPPGPSRALLPSGGPIAAE